jgi:hypothetical protein
MRLRSVLPVYKRKTPPTPGWKWGAQQGLPPPRALPGSICMDNRRGDGSIHPYIHTYIYTRTYSVRVQHAEMRRYGYGRSYIWARRGETTQFCMLLSMFACPTPPWHFSTFAPSADDRSRWVSSYSVLCLNVPFGRSGLNWKQISNSVAKDHIYLPSVTRSHRTVDTSEYPVTSAAYEYAARYVHYRTFKSEKKNSYCSKALVSH